MSAEQALQIIEPQQNPNQIALAGTPKEVLDQATIAAKALKDVIDKKVKKIVFNGKTYLQFEDWQTLGRFYGITVKTNSTKFVEFGEVSGFEATAEAINSAGEVKSSAEAMCLNDERLWAGKPLFQLRSMAQTRACAKALRNVLAWVVVLAGYEPTPAEEMVIESTVTPAPVPIRKEIPKENPFILKLEKDGNFYVGVSLTDKFTEKLLTENGFKKGNQGLTYYKQASSKEDAAHLVDIIKSLAKLEEVLPQVTE